MSTGIPPSEVQYEEPATVTIIDHTSAISALSALGNASKPNAYIGHLHDVNVLKYGINAAGNGYVEVLFFKDNKKPYTYDFNGPREYGWDKIGNVLHCRYPVSLEAQ